MEDLPALNLSPYLPFQLGQVVATKGVLELLTPQEMITLLSRHSKGDWGDLCQTDKDLNDQALKGGDGRLFSSYNILDAKYCEGDGQIQKIWVITEWDRSVTTVLLPSEY